MLLCYHQKNVKKMDLLTCYRLPALFKAITIITVILKAFNLCSFSKRGVWVSQKW